MLVQAGCWCQFSATKKTSQSTFTFAGYVIVCVCVSVNGCGSTVAKKAAVVCVACEVS